jgi:hypothetical protein
VEAPLSLSYRQLFFVIMLGTWLESTMSVILVKYLFRLSEKTRLDALAYDS